MPVMWGSFRLIDSRISLGARTPFRLPWSAPFPLGICRPPKPGQRLRNGVASVAAYVEQCHQRQVNPTDFAAKIVTSGPVKAAANQAMSNGQRGRLPVTA
jgi:hypothetical protein